MWDPRGRYTVEYSVRRDGTGTFVTHLSSVWPEHITAGVTYVPASDREETP
jgi:hypothetical protein